MSTRLAGHGMPYEGQALAMRTGGVEVRRDQRTAGQTRCECGEWSPVLPSNGARKRWHRDHKIQVREAAPVDGVRQ